MTLEVRLQSDSAARSRGERSLAFAPGSAAATTYDEVTRIVVDITVVDNGLPFYTNFDLTEISPDVWQGVVPILPRNRQLRFAARAYGPSGDLAFSGDTLATLTINNQNVLIPLAPAQDHQSFPIPRMFRIVYPAEIVAGQDEQVTFTVLGNAGAAIHVRVTSPGSSSLAAEFQPASGTVTLTNTVASFMTVFHAPDVSADTELDYQVTISSGVLSSIAVTTNFRILVKRRPPGPVQNALIQVAFHPMIRNVTANGSVAPGSVQLVADVSDDGPAAALAYQWSFQPADGTAGASFSNPAANPTVFEGYTLAHQGVVTLAVTDGDGGTTTLHYPLAPNQFADAIDHGTTAGLWALVAGQSHTCALTAQRKVRCWGDNTYGQLGYGNTLPVGTTPATLPSSAGDVLLGTEAVQQLAAGNYHTCALFESGLVTCWGNNQYGQLGYGRTDNLGDNEAVTSFGYVPLGGLATKIAAGADHTCAVLLGGAVRCWGYNGYGQLGHGHTDDIGDDEVVYRAGNVDLGDGVLAKDVTAGDYHSCALLTSGAVRCWGYNGYGQLGYGSSTSLGDDEPIANLGNVALPGPARRLVAGGYHTCALLEAGGLRCWGYNGYGQLGQVYSPYNPSWGDQSNETPADLPANVTTGFVNADVVTGNHHTCALSVDGKLKCWGDGSSGQLGHGGAYPLYEPATAIDLDGVSVARAAAGGAHTCALRVNGTVRCWGEAYYGQLGYGSTAPVYTPSAQPDVEIFEQP